MQVTVLMFGKIAEIVAGDQLAIQDVADTQALKRLLEQRYPALKTTTYRLAVNKQLVATEMVLENNATVALLPPFSGG